MLNGNGNIDAADRGMVQAAKIAIKYHYWVYELIKMYIQFQCYGEGEQEFLLLYIYRTPFSGYLLIERDTASDNYLTFIHFDLNNIVYVILLINYCVLNLIK